LFSAGYWLAVAFDSAHPVACVGQYSPHQQLPPVSVLTVRVPATTVDDRPRVAHARVAHGALLAEAAAASSRTVCGPSRLG
jgi:hypothetical protein